MMMSGNTATIAARTSFCGPHESAIMAEHSICVTQHQWHSVKQLVLGATGTRSIMTMSEYAATLPTREKGSQRKTRLRQLLVRSSCWYQIFSNQDARVSGSGWWSLVHARGSAASMRDIPLCLSRLMHLLEAWQLPLVPVLSGICQAVLTPKQFGSQADIPLDAAMFVVDMLINRASHAQLRFITREQWKGLICQAGVWEAHYWARRSSAYGSSDPGLKALLKAACMHAETTRWKQQVMTKFDSNAAKTKENWIRENRPSPLKLQRYKAKWELKRKSKEILASATSREHASAVMSILQDCERLIQVKIALSSSVQPTPVPESQPIYFYDDPVSSELCDEDDGIVEYAEDPAAGDNEDDDNQSEEESEGAYHAAAAAIASRRNPTKRRRFDAFGDEEEE